MSRQGWSGHPSSHGQGCPVPTDRASPAQIERNGDEDTVNMSTTMEATVEKMDDGPAPAAVTCEYTGTLKTSIPSIASAWGDWSR